MKSYTDLEQSKKLAKILRLESADHHYVRETVDFRGNPVDGKWSIPKYGNPLSSYANYIVQNFESYETTPCWSLAALLDVIPFYIIYNGKHLVLRMDKGESDFNIWYDIINNGCASDIDFTKSNPVDACYEMIIKLYEFKLL